MAKISELKVNGMKLSEGKLCVELPDAVTQKATSALSGLRIGIGLSW